MYLLKNVFIFLFELDYNKWLLTNVNIKKNFEENSWWDES